MYKKGVFGYLFWGIVVIVSLIIAFGTIFYLTDYSDSPYGNSNNKIFTFSIGDTPVLSCESADCLGSSEGGGSGGNG